MPGRGKPSSTMKTPGQIMTRKNREGGRASRKVSHCQITTGKHFSDPSCGGKLQNQLQNESHFAKQKISIFSILFVGLKGEAFEVCGERCGQISDQE